MVSGAPLAATTRARAVVSVASLLGEAINRIHAGTSVGEMFRTPALQLSFISI